MRYYNTNKYQVVFEIDYDLPGYIYCTIYDKTGEDLVAVSGAYAKTARKAFKAARHNSINGVLRK